MALALWCRIIGHRWVFAATGHTVEWRCDRDCDAGGSRRYASAGEARRFAHLLNSTAPRPPLAVLSALGGTGHREPAARRPGRREPRQSRSRRAATSRRARS